MEMVEYIPRIPVSRSCLTSAFAVYRAKNVQSRRRKKNASIEYISPALTQMSTEKI